MNDHSNRFSVTTRGMYDAEKCREGFCDILRSYPPEKLHHYFQDLLIMLHGHKLDGSYSYLELDNHIELIKQFDAVTKSSRVI